MTDVFTRERRSGVMARIKSGENKATECVLAAISRDLHMVRWRRNQKLFGETGFCLSQA